MTIDINTLSHDDIIDVRDIIERIEELEELIEADEINEDTASGARLNDDGSVFEDICTCGTCGKSWNDAFVSSRTPSPSGRCPYEHIHNEIEELKTLTAIMEDLKGNGGDEQWRGDWYPVTLIRDSYFEEYMDEMVADCYEVPKDLPSFMTITLDYVALQMDYTSTEIDGITYLYR